MLASMGALDILTRLAQPWATLYADHSWLQTTTLFLHLSGIFLGGGFAIATDRDTFIAVRAARLSGQIRHLGRIRTIHKPVLFGLGCILYEMLTGGPPYTGSSISDIVRRILRGSTPSAARANREVPPAVDRAVTRALAKSPADRFQSMREFADALPGPEA